MAGGYASDHEKPVDPFRPNGEKAYVPGHAINKAWMYDGFFWEEVPNLDFPRDRPACSLVNNIT